MHYGLRESSDYKRKRCKLSYLTENLQCSSQVSQELCWVALMKTTRRVNVTRAQEGQLKLTDKRQSLKHKENGRKLLLLGLQPSDKLAKPPFFVAYSRLCRYCRNLAEGTCRLSRFHFRPCRYYYRGSCRLSEFTLAGPS